MQGTTNGEHRKLIGVETMSLFGCGVRLYCWDAASVSESELRATVLCIYRTGVLERRYGETFYTRLSSRASSFLRPTGVPPPRISSLKPIFQRDKYEEYILYTTRRGAVSGVTLKSNLYGFLACST